MSAKILLIDDEPNIKLLLARILGLEGYAVDTAETGTEGLDKLSRSEYDILITDVKLPDADGVELVKKVKISYPELEVIVITAYGNIQDGVNAMKNGAFDYIMKGGDGDEVIYSVKNALEKISLRSEVQSLRRRIKSADVSDIITLSPAVEEAIEHALRVAATDSSVLLLGETGTGKELFAHLIHNNSARKNKHFAAINCSAIPKDLQESELFGYVRGAFTGAIKDKKGFFEEASGGTLFLDEVGDMSMDTQAKLLRFLESGKFMKVGGTKEVEADVRVVSATNKNLEGEIEGGTFRKDLFYRLNSFSISLPPLRDRTEDIGALAEHFAMNFSRRYKGSYTMSDEFVRELENYNWPGNIRELKNIIERAIILSDSNKLTPELLPKEFKDSDYLSSAKSGATLDALEKEYIIRVYNECANNKQLTAKKLGIGTATLYRKLKEYGIE